MRGGSRTRALLAGLTVAAALPALAVVAAAPGSADTAPAKGVPATVSADALPTAQINGVVWSQAVVKNTVYAGGNFTKARPAGATANSRNVTRTHLLAFDVRTGVLTRFAPTLNGQVTAVAASPDGRRLYVGGSFTRVNGLPRLRLAAFDTATGALVRVFAPTVNSVVRALAASNTTVYAGGAFTTANGVSRRRLAAFAAGTGRLSAWAPSADSTVQALVRTPDGTGVVVGGRFTTLSGRAVRGLGAVDAVRGRARAFAASAVVQNAGKDAAVTSLATDGRLVYGTGYTFGSGGNFEGTFAANPTTGALVWLEDCHGDTYSAAATGGVVYTVGHAHSCANVGGFPEAPIRRWQRALAFSAAATGTLAHNTEGRYHDFGGRPAPSLLTWWPHLNAGAFTGQSQGAWSVTTAGSYVVLGGEFTRVNGKPQQGLVRFAVRSVAPNRQGPIAAGAALGLEATTGSNGQVALSWKSTWDRDNESLTYTVTRVGVSTPVSVQSAPTRFWEERAMAATDADTSAGERTYRLTVADPLGNTVSSSAVTVTVSG